MNSPFIILVIVLAIEIPIVLISHIVRENAKEREGRRAQMEALERVRQDAKRREEGWAVRQDAKRREEGWAVRQALTDAYKSLTNQRAAGFRCWIPACIERVGRGEDVPAAVALMAIRWTLNELAGSRFDLSVLEAAAASLEAKTGDGE